MKNLLVLFLALFNFGSFASDHIDGPVTSEHAVTDLTDFYAFPDQEKPGTLSLVLNTYPSVLKRGHFSDKVMYVFHLNLVERGDGVSLQKGADKKADIYCTFEHSNHSMTCLTSNDKRATAVQNRSSKSGDFELFAGMRSDPFFFNLGWVQGAFKNGKLKSPGRQNILNRLNVLSIVIRIDVDKLFPGYTRGPIAAAVQSLGKDESGKLKQMDWIGRPEMTNFTLSAGKDGEELRDLYNKEIPLKESQNKGKYLSQVVENIMGYYDGLDGKQDWTSKEAEALGRLMLRDYLIVNPGEKCQGNQYFAIEMAHLEKRHSNSCGGRRPSDDIVDDVFSLYITKGNKKLTDGVDKPYREITKEFPYLSEPDLSALGQAKAKLFSRIRL